MELRHELDMAHEEIARLKAELSQFKRTAKEKPFGSSTPSSEQLVKSNTPVEKSERKGGAKPGHPGNCRKRFTPEEIDETVEHEHPAVCPDCGAPLVDAGVETRDGYELHPYKARRVVHRIHYGFCTHCKKKHAVKPGGYLPKSICSNQLIASVLTSHYGDGQPIGSIARRIGIGKSTLIGMEHTIAELLKASDEWIKEQYRLSLYKHADETKWRCRGKNTYTWIFNTDNIAIFRCADSRKAEVAMDIFGQAPHIGILCCDRFPGYYKAWKGKIQHCFEHLKRATLDIIDENKNSKACRVFAEELAKLLRKAMRLDAKSKTDEDYYRQAAEIQKKIEELTDYNDPHPAIANIQQIFRENHERLYHWVTDRKVRPENNLAESGLRPQVIARKVSFGSQSEGGMVTRERHISMVTTMKLRGIDPERRIREVLDLIASGKIDKKDCAKFLYAQDLASEIAGVSISVSPKARPLATASRLGLRPRGTLRNKFLRRISVSAP